MIGARKRDCIIRAAWEPHLFLICLLVALLAFCFNTMRSVPYTVFALVLTIPFFKFLLSGLRSLWLEKVIFEGEFALATNCAEPLLYETVARSRFAYWTTFHVSNKTLVLELKSTSTFVPSPIVVWDLGHFSMGAVGHTIVELCQRTSLASVEIQQSHRALDSDLLRVLKRRGQVTRDNKSGNTLFTPFRNSLC